MADRNRNRARIRAIRARMAATGEKYCVAMRAVDAEHEQRREQAEQGARDDLEDTDRG